MLTAEEKTVIERLSSIISKIPENKKLYLLGIGEGMAVMAEKQKKESKEIAWMINKEKIKAERLKSFQEFNHLSDDEMALFVYVHKKENVYKAIIVILIIVILVLLVLMWLWIQL